MNKPNKRRIFITYDKINFHRIFNINQSKNGDIYCSWPNYLDTKWVYKKENEGKIEFETTSTPSDSSKLSIHNSGVVKFRHNDFQFDPLRIKGNHLVNFENKNAGLRHLFTILINDPKKNSLGESPYGSRSGDFSIIANNPNSFAIIFYAIPQLMKPLTTKIQLVFDKKNKPENNIYKIGIENFPLGFHDIAMIMYEYSPEFPSGPIVFYDDGLRIPIPFEEEYNEKTKLSKIKIIEQVPAFQFENNELTISISFEGDF